MIIPRKSIVPLLMTIYIIFAQFSYRSTAGRYADEIITVFLFVYIVFTIIKNNGAFFNEFGFALPITLIAIIGITSNLHSNLITDAFYISLDILCVFKFFICFYGLWLMLDYDSTEYIVRFLSFLCKGFIVLSALFGLLSQLYDFGMTSPGHWGLNAYRFIFDYTYMFDMALLFALDIVVLNVKTERSKILYMVLVIVCLILSDKGNSIGCAACMILLSLYLRRNDNINLRLVVILGAIVALLCSYQISIYLLEDTAPRAIFYKYAFITAVTYFPFGSGFATYGSSVITEIYSPLYRKYGFNTLYGMTETDTSFLCDNYWPMVIGQFGFWGTAIMAWLYYKVFSVIKNCPCHLTSKVVLLSTFLYILIASIGSAITTSSSVVLLAFGLVFMIRIFGLNEDGQICDNYYKK